MRLREEFAPEEKDECERKHFVSPFLWMCFCDFLKNNKQMPCQYHKTVMKSRRYLKKSAQRRAYVMMSTKIRRPFSKR